MTKKASVFIAIPTLGDIHTKLALLMLKWQALLGRRLCFFFPENVSPHHRARNVCHRAFLESGYDYMLFIDSDTVPPDGTLETLLSANVPVVGTVVLTWKQGGPIPVAFRWDEKKRMYTPHYGKGVEKVDVTTMACTLIRRDVLEAVPHGVFKFGDDGDWDVDGYGEEFLFCRAVKEAGYEIYVDYDILCGHTKNIDLSEVNELLVENVP